MADGLWPLARYAACDLTDLLTVVCILFSAVDEPIH
jgi:hypothetical protein